MRRILRAMNDSKIVGICLNNGRTMSIQEVKLTVQRNKHTLLSGNSRKSSQCFRPLRSHHHMLKQHGSILRMLSSSYLVQMEKVRALLNHSFSFCVVSIINCSACVNSQVDNWNQPCYDLRLLIIVLRSDREILYHVSPWSQRDQYSHNHWLLPFLSWACDPEVIMLCL